MWFGLGLHTWEVLMLWSLAIVAVAGFAVVVCTRGVVVLQRAEIAESKDAFERYKVDAKAISDKANTEIASAKAETAKANRETAALKLALEKEIAARQPRTIKPEQHEVVPVI